MMTMELNLEEMMAAAGGGKAEGDAYLQELMEKYGVKYWATLLNKLTPEESRILKELYDR